MNDIQDLKQLVENVKSNINNIREKDNKNFHYQNNGDLITIIIERFLEQNVTEESKLQIIANNMKTEKGIRKHQKLNQITSCIFITGIFPSIFSIALIIILMIKGIAFDYPIIILMSIILITLISMLSCFKLSEIEDKKRASNRELISDSTLKNYNTQIAKVALSIIEDLNTLKNTENSESIEKINKRIIEEAYLFENGKTKDFMENSLKKMILNRLSHIEFSEDNKIKNKLIKNKNIFEDIPLENKLDFLIKKTL